MTNFFIGHNVDVDNFSTPMVCFSGNSHDDVIKFMNDPTGFPDDMFFIHPADVTNAINVGDFTFIHADCSFFSKVVDVGNSCDSDDVDINDSTFVSWFFSGF